MYSNAWVSSSFYPGIIFFITEITRQKEGGQADYADNSSGELPTLPLVIYQMSFFYIVTPLGLGMEENFFCYKYFTPTGFFFFSIFLRACPPSFWRGKIFCFFISY
jgi:hypothetical protein